MNARRSIAVIGIATCLASSEGYSQDDKSAVSD